MRKILALIALCALALPLRAQHSLITDDGGSPATYGIIQAPTVGGGGMVIYTLPVGGGTLLTAASLSAWDLSGNTLSGAEWFGSINGFDVIMKANSTEILRLVNGGGAAVLTYLDLSGTTTELRANGDAGTAGYVLQSNGPSVTPSWVPAPAPSGPAGGDLSGTYPNPVVSQINTVPLDASTATPGPGNILVYNGAAWQTFGVSGNASVDNAGVLSVNAVGSTTASDIATAVTTVLAATSSATPSTLVLRDGSAGFEAHRIAIVDQNEFRLYDADNSDYIGFQVQGALSGSTTFTLPDGDGTSGQALVTNGTGTLSWANFGGGTVTSVGGTSPINSTGGTTPVISIDNAVADGSTKGAAAFTASDFDAAAGVISIDYTNGQAASAGTKGFLTSADWTTFNGKQNALTTGNLSSSTTALTVTSGAGAVIGTGTSLSIADAAADGATKGIATFTAADFNAAAGVVSIDYTNGQAASAGTKGFLTSADWTTFNGKLSTVTADAPLSGSGTTGSHLVIGNAAADGATKGAAAFTASDFDAAAGVISIDYTNGQAASAVNKGFLTAANWSTFNGKQDALSGGTTNAITKWTSATAIGNSSISDDGSLISTNEPVRLGTVSSTTGSLRLANASSANLTTIQAGNATGAVTYTLPTAAPAADGYSLTSTTGGVMSWTNVSGGGSTSVVRRKSADESVTSSTTFQNDNDIYVDIPSGDTVEFSGILYATSGSATPDIKFQFQSAAAGDNFTMKGYMQARAVGGGDAGSTYYTVTNSRPATATSGSTSYAIAASGEVSIQVNGIMYNTSGSTIRVTLQWAQNTSNATATVLQANSYLKFTNY